jgi:hypothetical protein
MPKLRVEKYTTYEELDILQPADEQDIADIANQSEL